MPTTAVMAESIRWSGKGIFEGHSAAAVIDNGSVGIQEASGHLAIDTMGMVGGREGTLGVLDLELTGLISPRMRHIIKRYVKKVGLHDIKVEHQCDGGPATVRLVVTGVSDGRLTPDQEKKLNYLERAVRDSLSRPVNGFVPHPSLANPEVLRLDLCKVEPTMKRVFYTRA